jgi:hypothetical protein
MKAPPAIIIVGLLLALGLGYLAWQEPGPQPPAPDRPAGYQAETLGERP